MWRIPAPLIAGGGDIVLTIDSDTYIGNLYTFLGSPAGVRVVQMTIDGADVGEIIIDSSFAVGSSFEFITVNGGRILGVGGNGGNGGADFGGAGEAGEDGYNGGHAILNTGGYSISLNLDDGYLFGGGGGGGGGSYDKTTSTTGDAGNGGGGGQGWTGGTGGLGGTYIGLPAPANGANGSRLAAGAGGVIGQPGTYGGNGGTWGLGGTTGRSSDMISGVGGLGTFLYTGGLGGDAGRAYSGSSAPVFSGTDNEATLRADGRILGETGPEYINVPSFARFVSGFANSPANEEMGLSFLTDGALIDINTTTTPVASTVFYTNLAGSGTGANFQARVRNQVGDYDPSYIDVGPAAGQWVLLSSAQSWVYQLTNSASRGLLFEVRRSDIPGTTTTSDEVMASFFFKITLEVE